MKFSFSRFGPVLGLFLDKQVPSLVLVGRTWVLMSFEVRSSSKFVIFGFDPTLIEITDDVVDDALNYLTDESLSRK